MMLALKESIKRNKRLDSIIRSLSIPIFWTIHVYNSVMGIFRSFGIGASKYDFIKGLKDSHNGERCFIVATGPSLTFDDLNTIKNEYSFGMNACVLALDKTDWTPNLVGIQDEYVYKKIETSVLTTAKDRLKDKILVSDTLANLLPSAKAFPQFALDRLDRQVDHKKTGKIIFSEDCYKIVYDDYSIIFSLMQIAVYMGFKEICLLGCDCTYTGDKRSFIDHGAHDPNFDIAGLRLIYVHSKFKEFADAHGVKVYNCTRGGMLEEYPRKTLEEVLGQ